MLPMAPSECCHPCQADKDLLNAAPWSLPHALCHLHIVHEMPCATHPHCADIGSRRLHV